jgi:hypothetical protein
MNGHRFPRLVALFFVTLGIALPCPAQAPSEELLRYVPKDFGLCLVVNNLRAHAAQWDKSPWIKALKESTLGRSFVDAPELKELVKYQQDLQKHLDIDWPTLRDEVLGDAVVYAYKPGQPDAEQGIFLIRAQKPKVLVQLLDKLNKAQQDNGELKGLETREYKGTKYICRVEPSSVSFYLIHGPLFAFTAKEAVLKDTLIAGIVEQKNDVIRPGTPTPKKKNPLLDPEKMPIKLQPEKFTTLLGEHLKKAGAANSAFSLWINPRTFEADIKDKAKEMAGPEGRLLNALLKHASAVDALVLSVAAEDKLEFKLSVLARTKDLKDSARQFFMESAQPSDLWSRFPDNAIFSMAGRMQGGELAEALDFLPAEVRKLVDKILPPIAAMAGLDLAKDIAPHVGPDWGLCVLPATDPKKLPQVIAAVAVQPGPNDSAVDSALYHAVHSYVGLSLLNYNRKHQDDPIRLLTLKQEKVEVTYLANNTFFPPGFQPACALKDGYLLLTTTPEAVARFRTGTGPAGPKAEITEAPLLRISSTELAKALREHRQVAIEQLAATSQISRLDATQGVDETLSMLGLFDRIEITRSSGSGQANVVLRFTPAKTK